MINPCTFLQCVIYDTDQPDARLIGIVRPGPANLIAHSKVLTFATCVCCGCVLATRALGVLLSSRWLSYMHVALCCTKFAQMARCGTGALVKFCPAHA